MHYFDAASLRYKYCPDEQEEDYSKKKYIAKEELASDDWKTQAAQKFKNIPKGAEVKMIKKEYYCWYGKFSEVEWNGHIYYVDPNDIEEIERENQRTMSKGREALESLETEYYTENGERILKFKADDERLDTIEKELKAFDIIKEKKIDVVSLSCSLDAESYNLSADIKGLNDTFKITQEEFNLVNGVLNNDNQKE